MFWDKLNFASEVRTKFKTYSSKLQIEVWIRIRIEVEKLPVLKPQHI